MMIRLTSNLFVSSLILQFPLICKAQPSLGMQNMSDYGDVSVMCGLYSVLAAAEALDRIDAENMIFSADFVGKPGGSTAADLLACLQSREVGFTRDLSRLATDIVIDCRSPVDYRNEHVDGAINIPITTGIYELEQRLAQIGNDSGKPVLVYCQSVDCEWAEAMCNRLSCFGWNAEVLVGGFERIQQSKNTRPRGND